jgi:hypothetical protein
MQAGLQLYHFRLSAQRQEGRGIQRPSKGQTPFMKFSASIRRILSVVIYFRCVQLAPPACHLPEVNLEWSLRTEEN